MLVPLMTSFLDDISLRFDCVCVLHMCLMRVSCVHMSLYVHVSVQVCMYLCACGGQRLMLRVALHCSPSSLVQLDRLAVNPRTLHVLIFQCWGSGWGYRPVCLGLLLGPLVPSSPLFQCWNHRRISCLRCG